MLMYTWGPYSFNPIKGVSRTTISLTMPVLNSYFEWEYVGQGGVFFTAAKLTWRRLRLGTLRCASLKPWPEKRETQELYHVSQSNPIVISIQIFIQIFIKQLQWIHSFIFCTLLFFLDGAHCHPLPRFCQKRCLRTLMMDTPMRWDPVPGFG